MKRRQVLQTLPAAATLMAAPGPLAAAQAVARRGMPPLKITGVKVILTEPAGSNLVIVKVLTSEPGLYGVGCATHQERPYAVAAALDKHIGPFITGRNCDEIEDIWHSVYVASYFRSGVTLNNALSGIDGALWDILGKRTGVPVYQLLGGKARAAVPLYAHASGKDPQEVEDRVREWLAKGYRHVRVQVATPGFSGYGAAGATSEQVQRMRPEGVVASPVFEPTPYLNSSLKLFEHLRAKLGFDVELLHDSHERLPPSQALQQARLLEPYRLFFLEDPFAPEDVEWFRVMRQQTSTPLAMGELFVNRQEWLPLVSNRLIDFIRCHISAIGGLNMARKIASCCEFFNVRTAWHGPGNVSPAGHAVNMHLDLAVTNFGIQEQNLFSDRVREVFPGAPEIRGGYMYSNDRPGLGIDIDENAAAKYPYKTPGNNRGDQRRLDGSVQRP
ncbi:MAG TPA: enolase C-terminal domain-like protein [Bryobacteraceae bacterium]|nr:enolase C-terminal domain-like protein [Bryobacteraceae bacterium]